MKKETNHIFSKLLAFAFPFLLSCLLQTLYGMADLFIIGQYSGVDATTAVSIGSQVMHMVTVMIVGLAMGSTVLIGRRVGAGDRQATGKSIGNTVDLFLLFSLVATGILLLAVSAIVEVMSTPVEAVEGTVMYLTVCFLGVPFITAYNVICSIFRGMGDSKSPMYFVAIACIFNIVLDYVFIGALALGPMGAALGTTLAQAISVLLSLYMITHRNMGIHLTKADFKPDKVVMWDILRVGMPIMLQDGFIQISFLVITVFANQRGLLDAAAVGIVEKIIGFMFLVPSAMLSSVSALCAQYLGAGEPQNAKKTLHYAMLTALSVGLVFAILMQFMAEPVVGLFTEDERVMMLGGQYMHGYAWDCVLAGLHFCYSGYFCACQMSGLSFLHNAISILCARLPLSYLAAKMFRDTLFPMGLATTIGSGLSVIICVIAMRVLVSRNRKK